MAGLARSLNQDSRFCSWRVTRDGRRKVEGLKGGSACGWTTRESCDGPVGRYPTLSAFRDGGREFRESRKDGAALELLVDHLVSGEGLGLRGQRGSACCVFGAAGCQWGGQARDVLTPTTVLPLNPCLTADSVN